MMNRRKFLIQAGAGTAGVVAMPAWVGAATGPGDAAAMVLSTIGCSRATGYAETNKIVTLGERTHVAWLDSGEEGFRARVRTLDRTTGAWSPAYTVGEGYDNHGGPALAADSQGYLHMVYYPHHHPFRYRRSVRPNDASEWSDEVQFGSRCTYPTLMITEDDALILTCRESNRERKPWVVNRYDKAADGDWSEPEAIMIADEGGYSHFQEALAWGTDGQTLHLSTRMYGGNPGRAHTVGYMKSPDNGRTWLDAAGKTLELPATSTAITILASADDHDGTGSYRSGGIAVDHDGAAIVLYSSTAEKPSNAWLVKIDDAGRMQRQGLLPYAQNVWTDAAISMPGGVCVDSRGTIHVVLTVMPNKQSVGWGNPGNEIIAMTSPGFGKPFTARILSDVDPETPHWLPNLERPTGHNTITTQPGIIYTAGTRGGKNTEKVANRVIWTR